MTVTPVAERIGLDTFHFARRQFVFLPLALAIMISTSLLSVKGVRRLAAFILGAEANFGGSETPRPRKWAWWTRSVAGKCGAAFSTVSITLRFFGS